MSSETWAHNEIDVDEKHRLEESCLLQFVHGYNKLMRTHLRYIRHQDRPDFIVEDSESTRFIGIEVKHLFYDSEEAKILLGRSKRNNHALMNSHKLIGALNECLKNAAKRAQKYDFDGELFLVVRVASPIFDRSTFELFRNSIVIPTNVFNEIWLIFYDAQKQMWGELKRLK